MFDSQNMEGRGLGPGFLICAHDCASAGGLRRGPPAESGSGEEGNDEADGQGLHEGVGHVDDGGLVEVLRVLDFGDLRGGGGGVKSRGLDLVNLRGEVAVHKVRHEVEVKYLPRRNVADGGDERDQDAADEGAAEGDFAVKVVVAVAPDAEVDEQERRNHDGVAEDHAVTGADPVGEKKRAVHQDRDHDAGDEAEGEDGFLHVRAPGDEAPGPSEDGVTMQCNGAGCRHPFE